jgi:hypothetical protein
MRPQNSSTFDPTVDRSRKSNDAHNAWLEKHPREPRRSKSNLPQSTAAPRTALTFAALLAFAHVAEARSAISTSRAYGRSPQQGKEPPSGKTSRQTPGARSDQATDISDLRTFADRQRSPSTAPAVPIGGKCQPLAKRPGPPTGIPLIRIKRSGEAVQTQSIPDLRGDLPLSEHSLIAARVKAARKLLGKEAESREDEQLLDIANRIHEEAGAKPHDQAASAASLALYREEAEIWAAQSGSNEVETSAATRLGAFKEAWTLALEPPPPPLFKSRTELQREADDRVQQQLQRMSYLERLLSGIGIFGEGVNTSWAVKKAYNHQFSDYISRHLSRLCTAKAISNALEGGLKRLHMEYRPSKLWLINDVYLRRIEMYSSIPNAWVENQTEEQKMPALVFPMPGERRFGFIGPAGDFQFLDKDIFDDDGRLKQQPILRALGIAFDNTKKGMSVGCLISREQCHSSHFDFEMAHTTENPLSIKELMEDKVNRNALSLIERIREEKYDPSIIELGLRSLIPFFQVMERAQGDPDYKVQFKDISWDLFSLGLTIIPLTGLAARSLHAGFSAARAASSVAKGLTATARASAVLRAFLNGSKTSSFLRHAGRELTDFVVPVFTVKDIVRATKATPDVKTYFLRVTGEAQEIIPNLGARPSVPRPRQQVAQPAEEAATFRERDILSRIYHQLHRAGSIKKAHTPEMIEKHFDTRAELPIPDRLYRSQADVSISVKDRYVIRDDYLAAIIRHVAIYAGSGGKAVSLSMSRIVAERFKKRGYSLLSIDTRHDRQNFRTIENILKYDGPRLVKNGKIASGTLTQAIKNAFNEGEQEVFYTLGSIPDEWVEELL